MPPSERKQALVDECAKLLAARVRRMFLDDIAALFAQILRDRYQIRELEELRARLLAPPPQEEVKP